MTDEEKLDLLEKSSIKEIYERLDDNLRYRFQRDLIRFMDELLRDKVKEERDRLYEKEKEMMNESLKFRIDEVGWQQKEKELRGIIADLRELSGLS